MFSATPPPLHRYDPESKAKIQLVANWSSSRSRASHNATWHAKSSSRIYVVVVVVKLIHYFNVTFKPSKGISETISSHEYLRRSHERRGGDHLCSYCYCVLEKSTTDDGQKLLIDPPLARGGQMTCRKTIVTKAAAAAL